MKRFMHVLKGPIEKLITFKFQETVELFCHYSAVLLFCFFCLLVLSFVTVKGSKVKQF